MSKDLFIFASAAPASSMDLSAMAFACPVDFVFAQDENGKDVSGKQATFTMDAYNGGKMMVCGWPYPVVIDLTGMKMAAQQIPIRLQHDAEKGVGHTTRVDIGKSKVTAEGVISRATEYAKDVTNSAKQGFPWQASVGAKVEEYQFLQEGQTENVNGNSVTGPAYIMRKTTLGEISFVDLGADSTTSVKVAAQAPQPKQGESAMKFGEWLKAMGLDEATLTTDQRTKLQAKFDKENTVAAGGTVTPPATIEAGQGEDPIKAIRAQTAAEMTRISKVNALAVKHPEIAAKAISEGWDETRTELEVLRASRPSTASGMSAPNVSIPAGVQAADFGQVLECGLLQAGKVDPKELAKAAKQCGQAYTTPEEKHLAAADKLFRSGLGLQQLIIEAARANGYTGRSIKVDKEVMAYAFSPDLAAEGFSNVNISGILSNNMNKFLLLGFFMVEQTWRRIAGIRNVRDFKVNTSYRMAADSMYEEVTPAGLIAHGTLDEDSYTNQARTYGKLFAITRQDIINDDLGALTTVPRNLGRGAGLKLNDVFWRTFLANSSFFTTALGNYASGTDTTLTVDGLSKALAMFAKYVDKSGNPIGIDPEMLLTPPELAPVAAGLYTSSEIRDTTSSKQYTTQNVHVGKFEPVMSRYLSNSALTGNSGKAWYLLANPMNIAAIEVAFLNGQESPIIETAQANFSTLGIEMRGYHDFGVSLQDGRAAFKSKGEA